MSGMYIHVLSSVVQYSCGGEAVFERGGLETVKGLSKL